MTIEGKNTRLAIAIIIVLRDVLQLTTDCQKSRHALYRALAIMNGNDDYSRHLETVL